MKSNNLLTTGQLWQVTKYEGCWKTSCKGDTSSLAYQKAFESWVYKGSWLWLHRWRKLNIWNSLLPHLACKGDNKITRSQETVLHWLSLIKPVKGDQQARKTSAFQHSKKCLTLRSHWPDFRCWLLESELAFDSFPSSELPGLAGRWGCLPTALSPRRLASGHCLGVSKASAETAAPWLCLWRELYTGDRMLTCWFSNSAGRWGFTVRFSLLKGAQCKEGGRTGLHRQ